MCRWTPVTKSSFPIVTKSMCKDRHVKSCCRAEYKTSPLSHLTPCRHHRRTKPLSPEQAGAVTMFGFPDPGHAQVSHDDYSQDDQWNDDVTDHVVPVPMPYSGFVGQQHRVLPYPFKFMNNPEVDPRYDPRFTPHMTAGAFEGGVQIGPQFATQQAAEGQSEPQVKVETAVTLGSSTYPRASNRPPSNRPGMAYSAQQQHPTDVLDTTRAFPDSSSPEASEGRAPQDQGKPHRRGYQACQNCRSRKVKVSPSVAPSVLCTTDSY